MGKAIGDIIPLAIGVALSPVPIIAIVLMLGTPKATVNGIAFTVGWVAGLTIVGAIMLAVAQGTAAKDSGAQSTWASVLQLALGLLFLLLAVRQWHGRPPPGEEAPTPKWMQTIDTFSAGRALGFGLAMSGVNPKNLALTVGAATAIGASGVAGGQAVGALAVFIFVGSLTILAPLAIYFVLGERARTILGGLKAWMAEHNPAIMTVLLTVLGGKLIGDAITGFSS
jgi:hypothetical protein